MTCCTCTGIFCLVPHDYKKGRWDMPSFYRVGNENSEMLNQVIQLIRSRARIWTRICVIPEPILDLPQLCCSSTRKKKSKYDMTGVYVHRDNCYRQAREKKLVLRETLSSCLWPPENTVALLLNGVICSCSPGASVMGLCWAVLTLLWCSWMVVWIWWLRLFFLAEVNFLI